jgi:hypothetical protein
MQKFAYLAETGGSDCLKRFAAVMASLSLILFDESVSPGMVPLASWATTAQTQTKMTSASQFCGSN